MALFASNPSQQRHLRSTTTTSLCKCSSTLNSFFQFRSPPSHSLPFPQPKRNLQTIFSPPLSVGKAHYTHSNTNLSTSDPETATSTTSGRNDRRNSYGFSSFRDKDKRVDKKSLTKSGSSVVDGSSSESINFGNRRKMGSGFSSDKDENLVKKLKETIGTILVKEDSNRMTKKGVQKRSAVKKTKRRPKNVSVDLEGGSLRVGLDMCSKKGDAMGALELYDSAQREGTKMGQYQYSVLLYLCSSAATGVVRPAKSGSSTRSLSKVNSTSDDDDDGDVGNDDEDVGNDEDGDDVGNEDFNRSLNGKKLAPVSNEPAKPNSKAIDGRVQVGSSGNASGRGKDVNDPENGEIRVSDEFKQYALRRGFEIYEKMCLERVPMNEAILTSIARMALAMGDGDMAFDTVKQMKSLGINPRLRSYGPALSAFCNTGDIEKAFTVEEHMREHGVYPEEPELEALLRLSIEAGRSDKVYYLLHKLRMNVRKVSPATACLIEKWFSSKVASKVGRRKVDKKSIREAIKNGGGGWHGQGWLGRGKWIVSRTCVGDDGLCKACGERLATIDLAPVETEKFAESVASIATKREKNSSFQKFQKWLDYYGPFEAVVDGANVGLFSQRGFKPSKVNAVANGIRQLLPSKRWPLIVLHNRRIVGDHMNKPVNKAHIERWKNFDALYATPTGSNDDWYWLYAAIKFKCLMVTNDEMRDHLFQLLGNDFFPKWKERHQVHFSFSDGGPVFHMPPPCSVVIQESENGHWHVPVASEHEYEGERTWLCVVRANSYPESLNLAAVNEEQERALDNKRHGSSDSQSTSRTEPSPINQGNNKNGERCYGGAQGHRNLDTTSVSEFSTILRQIETAEKQWSSVIDFQI